MFFYSMFTIICHLFLSISFSLSLSSPLSASITLPSSISLYFTFSHSLRWSVSQSHTLPLPFSLPSSIIIYPFFYNYTNRIGFRQSSSCERSADVCWFSCCFYKARESHGRWKNEGTGFFNWGSYIFWTIVHFSPIFLHLCISMISSLSFFLNFPKTIATTVLLRVS